MAQSVASLLHELGPSLSSELIRRLVADGITEDAARQRVSRAKAPVRRLSGLTFPNREAFLFIDGEFGSDLFKQKLTDAFMRSGSRFGTAIRALEARGGAVPWSEFPIASGLPVENAKGLTLHVTIELKLLDLKLISKIHSPDGEIIRLADSPGITARRRAVRIVEDIVLAFLKQWLVKTNWTSSNAVKLRGGTELPTFGQFAWDITAPTYLGAMRGHRNGEVIPGFIVGDILLDRTLSGEDLQAFFNKWDALLAQRRFTSLQPILIADFLDEDALHLARKKGAFLALPANMLGESVARDLKSLINTIENAAAAVASDPGRVFELVSRLSRIEGAALNLRGVVIEMIVAHAFKTAGYSIEIRQLARGNDGSLAEIDVKATNGKEVVCCECKGMAPGSLVDEEDIRDWLDRSLPRIKAFLNRVENMPNQKRFEFYSSTDYTDSARTLISEIESAHKKQPVKFLTGRDLIKRLQDLNETSLVRICQEQFVKI